VDDELREKVFNYIATLEKTNAELVKTLELCVDALSKFESSAPDAEGFQELMDAFHRTIKGAAKTTEEKPFH
jgi:coenzyme F420-reducing hydrogenase delta subunit